MTYMPAPQLIEAVRPPRRLTGGRAPMIHRWPGPGD